MPGSQVTMEWTLNHNVITDEIIQLYKGGEKVVDLVFVDSSTKGNITIQAVGPRITVTLHNFSDANAGNYSLHHNGSTNSDASVMLGEQNNYYRQKTSAL